MALGQRGSLYRRGFLFTYFLRSITPWCGLSAELIKAKIIPARVIATRGGSIAVSWHRTPPARLPSLGPRRCARAGQGRSGFHCAAALRNLATVKFGSSRRPASRASAARPLSAEAAARKNWVGATFGLISTDLRSRSRADSSRPRNRSATAGASPSSSPTGSKQNGRGEPFRAPGRRSAAIQ